MPSQAHESRPVPPTERDRRAFPHGKAFPGRGAPFPPAWCTAGAVPAVTRPVPEAAPTHNGRSTARPGTGLVPPTQLASSGPVAVLINDQKQCDTDKGAAFHHNAVPVAQRRASCARPTSCSVHSSSGSMFSARLATVRVLPNLRHTAPRHGVHAIYWSPCSRAAPPSGPRCLAGRPHPLSMPCGCQLARPPPSSC